MSNVSIALYTCNINYNSVNTFFFPMTNYDRVMFILTSGSSNGAGSPTFVMEARQCLYSNGTGNISMAANVTNTAVTGANKGGTIEWRGDQMNTNAGYIYAGCLIYETNANISTVTASSLRESARYPQIANAVLP